MKGCNMRLYEIADYNVDGVIIKPSNRTNTGFEGVTFSVNWRPAAPFVASAKMMKSYLLLLEPNLILSTSAILAIPERLLTLNQFLKIHPLMKKLIC